MCSSDLDCHLKLGGMKMEFRVIVDHTCNGEVSIRDELTVCRWEGAWIGGNCDSIIMIQNI